MKANKWLWIVLGVTLSAVVLLGFLFLAASRDVFAHAGQSPAQPGVAISPGVTGRVNGGDVVTYYHTITNTGGAPGLFSISARASEEWPLYFYNTQFPTGTVFVLPFMLLADETATIAVQLTVPKLVRPGTVNTTWVTATATFTSTFPYAYAAAQNTAIVLRRWYTPLVMRNYAPFLNGDFSNGLLGWTVNGVLGAALDVDPDQPANPVGRVGNPGFSCLGVPRGYGSLSQTFSVPQAPPGKSMHLQFRYRIYSNDQNVSLSSDKDTFDVLVNGELRWRDANRGAFNYCSVPPYDLGWKLADINLGANGMLVELAFQAHNRFDTFYNTYVLVDDVEIFVGD